MRIFKSKQKKFEGDLKIQLCGKRICPTEGVKYLGVKIDTNLSWQYHVSDLSIKINRADVLLFKMREYVSLKILRSIYFAIFDSLQKKTQLELSIFNGGILIRVRYSNSQNFFIKQTYMGSI